LELYEVAVAGYRKFRDVSRLKTNGKLVAILGANEAGKSSLIGAIERLNDNDPFENNEVSHDLSSDKVSLTAKFLLNEADRAAANVPNAVWYTIEKGADGTRRWSILPRPPGRDITHRRMLLDEIKELSDKPKFVEAAARQDAELLSDLRDALSELAQQGEDVPAEEFADLEGIVDRLRALADEGLPAYTRPFLRSLDQALQIEKAQNARLKAGRLLWDRIPKFLMFGAEDRELKTSYSVTELSDGAPRALTNLMQVADCDLPHLLAAYAAGDAAKVDTLIDSANEHLQGGFRAVWKQSAVSVVFSLRDQVLHVQVRNPDRRRTAFSERSDGLRQFVALQSFTAASGETDPILLIDEAEQHLHYDAQADLMKMLASQEVASKVIYTTHSAGCLPEDLGNGVRLVTEVAPGSEWSRVQNKFWDSRQTTLSPLLIGMGASTLAFFPTRVAVVVEGESDMLLYPVLVQRALGMETTGMQFVPGLSRIDKNQLPMLQTVGKRVAFLMDNDSGGRALAKDLLKVGVAKESIFSLSRPGKGDVELEDFLDPNILAFAVNELGRRHYNNAELVQPNAIPRYGKWKYVADRCEAAGVPIFQKVDVAYAILDRLADDPKSVLLEKRLTDHFGTLMKQIRERLEADRL
jgi:predicted ATP-dependent endonuclease of OLD family